MVYSVGNVCVWMIYPYPTRITRTHMPVSYINRHICYNLLRKLPHGILHPTSTCPVMRFTWSIMRLWRALARFARAGERAPNTPKMYNLTLHDHRTPLRPKIQLRAAPREILTTSPELAGAVPELAGAGMQ